MLDTIEAEAARQSRVLSGRSAAILALAQLLPGSGLEFPVRAEANYVVGHIYRNEEIENIHGGEWNPLVRVPGFARMTPGEVGSVARTASIKLAVHLALRELVPTELLLTYMTRIAMVDFNSEWSLAEETSDVDYRWATDAPPPTRRLKELQGWFPVATPADFVAEAAGFGHH
jgi:hypothetical protein